MQNLPQYTSKLRWNACQMERALDNLRSGRPCNGELDEVDAALINARHVLCDYPRTDETTTLVEAAARVVSLYEELRPYRQ